MSEKLQNGRGRNVASLIFGLALVVFGGWLIYTSINNRNEEVVIFENAKVAVEIPGTPGEYSLGLGNRDFLDSDKGMLFVYDSDGQRYFWMENMRFAIDIIWINSDKKVVDITKNLAPESYPERFTSIEPAQYVLEVNAGFSDENNIEIGDKAIIRL